MLFSVAAPVYTPCRYWAPFPHILPHLLSLMGEGPLSGLDLHFPCKLVFSHICWKQPSFNIKILAV